MKTIGQLLKEAREKQSLSLDQLSKITKIRPDYLKAIEEGHFDSLPSATFVKGFIVGYAKAVATDPQTALAVFRRDYDQNQQGKVVPRGLHQPLKSPSRVWNPRTTTIVVAAFMLFLVSAYVTRLVFTITGAPEITLSQPSADETYSSMVPVAGKTTSDATIIINHQPVSLKADGSFETTLNLSPGQHTLIVESESRDGKTRTLTRTITVTAPE